MAYVSILVALDLVAVVVVVVVAKLVVVVVTKAFSGRVVAINIAAVPASEKENV